MRLKRRCEDVRVTHAVKLGRTYEPPGIPSLVNFHARGVDIGRVAEVWQPHVLDVKIIKGLKRE